MNRRRRKSLIQHNVAYALISGWAGDVNAPRPSPRNAPPQSGQLFYPKSPGNVTVLTVRGVRGTSRLDVFPCCQCFTKSPTVVLSGAKRKGQYANIPFPSIVERGKRECAHWIRWLLTHLSFSFTLQRHLTNLLFTISEKIFISVHSNWTGLNSTRSSSIKQDFKK